MQEGLGTSMSQDGRGREEGAARQGGRQHLPWGKIPRPNLTLSSTHPSLEKGLPEGELHPQLGRVSFFPGAEGDPSLGPMGFHS